MMLNGCGAHPLVVVGCSLFAAPNTRQNYKKMQERTILAAHFHGYSKRRRGRRRGDLQLNKPNNAVFVDTQRGRIASLGEGGRT